MNGRSAVFPSLKDCWLLDEISELCLAPVTCRYFTLINVLTFRQTLIPNSVFLFVFVCVFTRHEHNAKNDKCVFCSLNNMRVVWNHKRSTRKAHICNKQEKKMFRDLHFFQYEKKIIANMCELLFKRCNYNNNNDDDDDDNIIRRKCSV